ncbi:MAG TPA: sugar transferase [Gemmatimonadales bacterium]|jgi:exopolysaccharide biosynthesis polyprenyl glycosylphosphotransferase|nr:sugar transferase [Gemmatimonadales bacterium]
MTLSPPLRPRLSVPTPERVRAPSSAEHQNAAVRLYLKLCRSYDTVIALGALIGLFVIDNLGRLPTGLDDFLGARLTVKNCLLAVIFANSWYLSCRWAGLYDWVHVKSRKSEALRVFGATSLGTLIAVIFPLTSKSGAFHIDLLLPFLALGTGLMLAWRAVLRSTTGSLGRTSRTLLIVGAGPRGQELRTLIKSEGNGEVNFLGFVDSDIEPGNSISPLCSLDGLERFLMGQELDEVLIALPVKSRYAEIQRTIQICERVGVPVKYSASLFAHTRREPRVEYSSSGPVLSVPAAAEGPRLLVKRAIDLFGAGLAAIVLSPLMVAIGVAIKLTSPGPVFFAQLRYGRDRRRFMMYKFRTMVDGAEDQQVQLEELNEVNGPVFKIRMDPRITPLGAFLRRTSLDELPQLWNVLRGDMSLVGPRPLPLRDVSRFQEAWLMRRFSMFPGITGLWQVSGRSDVAFDDWIQLDLAYIDRWSLILDLWILARTIPAVISGKGAS